MYFVFDQRLSGDKGVWVSASRLAGRRLPRKDSVGSGEIVRLCLCETLSFRSVSGGGSVGILIGVLGQDVTASSSGGRKVAAWGDRSRSSSTTRTRPKTSPPEMRIMFVRL